MHHDSHRRGAPIAHTDQTTLYTSKRGHPVTYADWVTHTHEVSVRQIQALALVISEDIPRRRSPEFEAAVDQALQSPAIKKMITVFADVPDVLQPGKLSPLAALILALRLDGRIMHATLLRGNS